MIFLLYESSRFLILFSSSLRFENGFNNGLSLTMTSPIARSRNAITPKPCPGISRSDIFPHETLCPEVHAFFWHCLLQYCTSLHCAHRFRSSEGRRHSLQHTDMSSQRCRSISSVRRTS